MDTGPGPAEVEMNPTAVRVFGPTNHVDGTVTAGPRNAGEVVPLPSETV